MDDKYLNETGLQRVADKVNTRLKTVSVIPLTAKENATRFYIGANTAEFTKGHTYQAHNTDYFAWQYGTEPDPVVTCFTESETPEVGDNVYNNNFEILGTITSVGTGTIEYDGNTFDRNTEEDTVKLTWTDISPADDEAREVAAGAMALAQEAIEQGGNAEDVDYSNPSKPDLTNVKLALDDVIAKVYYIDPAITSFTMTPSTTEYEIGQSVSDIAFAWTYNKDIVSQTLTDCTLADETVRSATASGPYTSNKTFTLSASDGQNSTSQSKSISFKHKVYWGAASEPSEFTSEFILALTGKKFATNYKGSYNMNLGEGQFGYLAYPSSWGNVTSWWIGGFEVETHDCGTISFTNASGNTTTFRITRTSQPSLGSITAEVK